jgi:methylated-DNA-protein-cysteine methyltransferase-like protein
LVKETPESTINDSYLKIWRTVQLIPKGNVACYGQIADLAGLPGRARLVGKCLGFAPSDGVDGKPVPWFRVINAAGKISFPVGSEHFERQKSHLQEEQVVVIGARIKLKEYQWQPDLAELLFKLNY